jgi:ABC-type amino acid transport substrate-binding protein
MKMKKILALSVIAAMTLTMTSCGEKKNTDNQLIIGTEAGFAPYEYLKGDTVVGVDMDICQAIADEMGKELVIKNMDFDGALAAAQQGKVDLVASGVSVTEERKKSMDFSESYINTSGVVVVNKETNAVTTPTGEALEGKNIGVQQGNTSDLWVSDEENVKPGNITRYTKFAQASEDLKNNKIDCIVMDELPAEELVAASGGSLVIVEGEPLFVEDYALATKKGNAELLKEVDQVIIKLKEEGKIDEFLADHIG